MNAISKRSALSLPRHCTHGSLANVVMPENMESAVTGKYEHKYVLWVGSDEPSLSPG